MSLVSSRPRRNQIDIIVNILRIASKAGSTKTSLVYKSNLNFILIQKYIDLLQQNGLLEMDKTQNGLMIYKTTKKGSEALEALRIAINLVFEESRVAATATTTALH